MTLYRYINCTVCEIRRGQIIAFLVYLFYLNDHYFNSIPKYAFTSYKSNNSSFVYPGFDINWATWGCFYKSRGPTLPVHLVYAPSFKWNSSCSFLWVHVILFIPCSSLCFCFLSLVPSFDLYSSDFHLSLGSIIYSFYQLKLLHFVLKTQSISLKWSPENDICHKIKRYLPFFSAFYVINSLVVLQKFKNQHYGMKWMKIFENKICHVPPTVFAWTPSWHYSQTQSFNLLFLDLSLERTHSWL